MLTAPPPPPPDNRALLFMFTGWLTLPVDDWIWLLEFAQREGQSLEAYLAHVLHDHVVTHPLTQETPIP